MTTILLFAVFQKIKKTAEVLLRLSYCRIWYTYVRYIFGGFDNAYNFNTRILKVIVNDFCCTRIHFYRISNFRKTDLLHISVSKVEYYNFVVAVHHVLYSVCVGLGGLILGLNCLVDGAFTMDVGGPPGAVSQHIDIGDSSLKISMITISIEVVFVVTLNECLLFL